MERRRAGQVYRWTFRYRRSRFGQRGSSLWNKHTVMRPLVIALTALLGACAGESRLSDSVVTLNEEVADLQNRTLLLNIVRRSLGHPLRFTTLSLIRGRDRVTTGAGFSIPFGGAAPARFEFNPSLNLDQGPSFELSTQDNEEFYQGLLSPIAIETINYYFQQDYPRELILLLMVDRIRVRTPAGQQLYVNRPEQEREFRAFEDLLADFIDQGFTTEPVELVRDLGPALPPNPPPSIDQILAVHREGLRLERTSPASGNTEGGTTASSRLQVRQLLPVTRFCFDAPISELYREASCAEQAGAARPRFETDDPHLFSYTADAAAVFDAGETGRIEIFVRSLAEVLTYLGELTRIAVHAPQDTPDVRTWDGRESLFVVRTGEDVEGIVAVDYQGTRYAVPTGEEAGQSGDVLSLVSQLLAQAQSVKDLPVSNTVTVIGE